MKKNILLLFTVPFAIVISLSCIAKVYSQEYKALVGLESINAVFDFRKNDAQEVVTYLNLVHGTFKGANSITTDNVDFVVVFTGSVVKLLSTNRDGISSEDHESIDNIAATIAAMAKDGIKLEICLFAVRLFGVEPESILPEIEQLENGWLSLIGYQAKQYSLLPIY